MKKQKPTRLFNVRMKAYEYSMIQAAASASGLSMAKFLRGILMAEAKKVLEMRIEKESDKKL